MFLCAFDCTGDTGDFCEGHHECYWVASNDVLL